MTKKTLTPRNHPKDSPYNHFYPLFNKVDPKYMKEFKNIENINDDTIFELAKSNIVTKFEDILKIVK
jgi:hypothetical protein